MSYSVISHNSNFSVSINDGYYCYLIDASSNNIDVQMEDISLYDGVAYLFINISSNSSYTVTLNAYTGQYIDGSSTKVISVADKSFELISFGQNWISHK